MLEMDAGKRFEVSGEADRILHKQSQQQTLNIDTFLDAFIKTDDTGVVVAWNLQAQEVFGWTASEALGCPVYELIVPVRNRNLFRESLQLALTRENEAPGTRTRITALHKAAAEFEVETVFFPICTGERLEIGIFARQSEQRRFTETEADERRHAIMDQLADCYTEVDLRGQITFVNKAYCKTFGISPEDRQGHNYKTVLMAELAELFLQAYGEVYRTGEPTKIDYSLTLPNGKRVFNEQSISLRRDAQGNAVGFMAIVRDCFERKQNEIEMVKAKQAAEAASKAKGNFLANMSHEIRTPLNGVIGMLELLGYTNPTSEQQEFLRIAEDAANSLLEVINDVLDFSKIEAGKLELDRVKFGLAEIVSQAVGISKINASRKSLEMAYELAPDVPPLVVSDPIRLKQVLLNLLGNAVKFTQQGQVQARVRVKDVKDTKIVLEFSVSDTGIGIPLEKQAAIFAEFSQVDASTTRRFGGTGLGLAICSRIVQLMGGHIWVESEVGEGSTFCFTAVLERAVGSDVKPDGPAIPYNDSAPSLRVLLAEDNPINQRLAVRLLEKLGHRVVVAGNGVEAVEKFREQSFDLVFMDVQMPEMDGFNATAAIRAATSNAASRVPIIAMTAHAMQGDRDRCLQAGMDDYISKPISSDAIRKTIANVLHLIPEID